MRLVERFTLIKMWQKLVVIALALGLPAVALAGFYISALSYDGGFLKAELNGLDHIEPLNKLNDQITAYRTMVDASVRGDQTEKAYFRSRLAESRNRIDEAIKVEDAADAKSGSLFGTSEQWKKVKSDWASLADRATDMKPEDAAERHTKILTDLATIQVAVSEKSNLILDPILVTYYLQDNLTLRTTSLIDFVGQTRALALEIAAKKEITLQDRYKLSQLLGQVAAARSNYDGNVTILKDRDANAYNKLAPKFAEATAAADAFVTLVQTKFVEAPTVEEKAAITVPPADVWEKGSNALAAYQKVNDEDMPVLRSMLTARYEVFSTRLYGTAVFIVIVLLLASALVYGIASGITQQLGEVKGVLAEIGIGNVNARATVTSQDELGDLAFTLNAMLDNTLSLMQSQEERDQIQTSIQRLLEEVAGVAEGDLTKEAEVTADVTGAIADSFNYMLDQLRGVIGSVQRATIEVTGSAGDIYTSTQQLAGGAEQQAVKIATTSKAVEAMSVSIHQVSDNAAQSATVARQALQNARQGNVSVKNTITGMDRIRDQVQETAKRIKRLGESSQEIGQITQLIDDIADRTSILALNASIQAAMAGEAGRGFAVVAEEVERLADRSTEATKKIAALVKSIQSETNEAVGAMEKGIQEVVEGSKLAGQAGQALDEIEGVSNKLAELIQQISHAATQQARASEGVTEAMIEISSITQDTATGTKQAADAVQGLASLADGLRESVATFRLPGAPAPKVELNGYDTNAKWSGRANGKAVPVVVGGGRMVAGT
ncbi:MAG: HAMP domain-containing protein [Planctomycetes bacterium]|nr:HAMP domain-containing protein [Planctomycetota bacterium]